MKQKYLLGDRAKVIIEGIIKEVYIGYDSKRGEIIKYKIVADDGTAIGVEETAIIAEISATN